MGRESNGQCRRIRRGQLRAEAWVENTEGVKTFAAGQISDAAGVTVSAEGIFIHPRMDDSLPPDQLLACCPISSLIPVAPNFSRNVCDV